MNRRQTAALTIVVLGAMAICLLAHHLTTVAAEYQQLRQTGLETTARVVDPRTYGRISLWSIEYSWEGKAYRGSVQCDLLCFDEGQAITIYVDQEDSTRFITDSGQASTSSANILWPVVAVVAMAAVFAAGYLIRSWILAPTR